MGQLTSVEICAGGGGQALGLEMAGFQHVALIEIDRHACATLRTNRPRWNVIEGDLKDFAANRYVGVSLLAGGVPCPPFSKAGKQLGIHDERDLFPQALRLVRQCRPRAVMIENVRGLLDPIFDSYRASLMNELKGLGYVGDWKILNASDFGVPQLRPRAVLVAMEAAYWEHFSWPEPKSKIPPTVGDALYRQISSRGWTAAQKWREQANKIAPTLVGGSRKHGGPDLGPTRAKQTWADMGVDAMALADTPPSASFRGMPRLTVQMTATLQGFPSSWKFVGGKTAAYRQVGNAFPPPVAKALGLAISAALSSSADIGEQLALVSTAR